MRKLLVGISLKFQSSCTILNSTSLFFGAIFLSDIYHYWMSISLAQKRTISKTVNVCYFFQGYGLINVFWHIFWTHQEILTNIQKGRRHKKNFLQGYWLWFRIITAAWSLLVFSFTALYFFRLYCKEER